MAVRSIFPIVQGVGYGLVSSETKRFEDSVRAGGNAYLTTSLQIAQGSNVVFCATKALQATGRSPLSWAGQAVLCLTPLLLTALRKSKSVSENLQPALTFIQNHLTTLYQLATVVSCVVLLYFGQTLFALPALCVLGIGFMDQRGWLPCKYRQLWHRYNQPLIIITGLIAGGVWGKAFGILNGLSWFANRQLSKTQPIREQFTFAEKLTPSLADDYLNGRIDLQINRKHLHYPLFPPVPDIDIECLVQKFDEILWANPLANHIPALRQKLSRDPRFLEQYQNLGNLTDQECIAIAKRTLQSFITSVKEHRILQGEPADYEKMHNYLKLIAKHLQEQPDEIIRTDILLRLAIEGGEYCGPGKFEVAESIFAQTIGENPDIPFREKVLYCLQDERNLWMQKFYNTIYTRNPLIARIGQLLDWLDIHNYNLFINLYGEEFGLRKAGADNDDTAIIEPLLRWIVSRILQGSIHRLFWLEHQQSHLTDTLIEAAGTSKLPKPEVYAFWQSWIDRQQIAASEKAALHHELSTGSLYGLSLEVNGKMRPEFIHLMLFDLGISLV